MAQSVMTPGFAQSPASLPFHDMQGLLRFGHRHLTEACFLLLRIAGPAAARAWIASAPVTSAATEAAPPDTALHIAFTCAGLRRLGLADDTIAGFSDEFIRGMSGDDDRSRRLGDVGANSPAEWKWGGADRQPDVLLMLYARAGGLRSWTGQVTRSVFPTAFAALEVLSTTTLAPPADGLSREPFGFADGISQPQIDWQMQLRTDEPVLTYRNRSALGEFVLGYPNEYANYTDRPLLDPARDPNNLLSAAHDDPSKRDLGRNGTYLVLRDLRQDVDGFWHYQNRQAEVLGLRPEQLAEAMVGRTMAGMPLAARDASPISGVDPQDHLNQFTFQADPLGTACPLGAHIRRVNPRNADMPNATPGWWSQLVGTLGFGTHGPRDDLIASTRFHRLLRRGRAYGEFKPDQQPRNADPTQEVGLRFICLNANIARQFEFVQTAWVNSTKFGGLTHESDPLLGNRQPIAGCPATDTFSIPQPTGAALRLRSIPRFVTVRGGAYFFLPGLSGLRYLASLPAA
jgi:deferrochelatase/peroxidase EfeB